jgi:predicted trehalose synthase
VEPPDQNIRLSEKSPLPTLIGLWKMLEEIHGQLQQLHGHGLLHGDMQLGNVIISPSPIHPYLIDFEGARIRAEETEAEWKKKCEVDYVELLRESIYLQCGLGQQRGGLANHSLDQIITLFRDPEPFTSAIKGVGVTEG